MIEFEFPFHSLFVIRIELKFNSQYDYPILFIFCTNLNSPTTWQQSKLIGKHNSRCLFSKHNKWNAKLVGGQNGLGAQ